MKLCWMTLAVAAMLGFGMPVRAELVDAIEAVVHDSIITLQQIEIISGPNAEVLSQQYRYQPEMLHQKMTELRSSIFTNMIERELVLSYFKTMTNKVNESILNQIVMDEIHAQHTDRVQLTKDLQQQGLTFEDYRQKVRDGLIYRELMHENVPEPIISPQKIENYYQAHHDNYKLADQVKLRMIVLKKTDPAEEARKRGEEILSQLKGGASFQEMAMVNSEGSQRKEGGETGWEDAKDVDQALMKEIDKLKLGEYSGVIETREAFFLLLLEDRHPAHIKPLGEVRDEVERTLKNQEMERLRKKWIDRLRAKTYIGTF
ncbi:MAG TPA: peptidyl-prolyl cis-trans isomerase [Verrucomicrobiae bacterium]|nr:peptidyl-prolyl cis-trans isomerase [Verrucomicrobiae bacterium]